MQGSRQIAGIHGSGSSSMTIVPESSSVGAVGGAAGGVGVTVHEGSNESLSSADTNSKSTFSRVCHNNWFLLLTLTLYLVNLALPHSLISDFSSILGLTRSQFNQFNFT